MCNAPTRPSQTFIQSLFHGIEYYLIGAIVICGAAFYLFKPNF